MNMQSIYQSSENAAVFAAFILFIVLHAGLLYLFGAV